MGKRSNGTRSITPTQAAKTRTLGGANSKATNGLNKSAIKAVMDEGYNPNTEKNFTHIQITTSSLRGNKWYEKAVKNKDVETITRERKTAASTTTETRYVGNNRVVTKIPREVSKTLVRYGDRYVVRTNYYEKRHETWSLVGGDVSVYKAKKKAFK